MKCILNVKMLNVFNQRLPILLDNMFTVKILLLLKTDNQEERKVRVMDFISIQAIPPTLVGKSVLKLICLFKDLLFHRTKSPARLLPKILNSLSMSNVPCSPILLLFPFQRGLFLYFSRDYGTFCPP